MPVDLREGAGALRGAQGRREARPGGRGAGQPRRARTPLFRAGSRYVGARRVRRGVPVRAQVRACVRVRARTGEGRRAVIPLYGFLEGDTIGLLVLGHAE